MNRMTRMNRPMATMLRIRRRSRPVRSVWGPGSLVLTDEGLLGRVKGLIENPGSEFPAQIEVDDLGGGIVLVSSRDIRLVYS